MAAFWMAAFRLLLIASDCFDGRLLDGRLPIASDCFRLLLIASDCF